MNLSAPPVVPVQANASQLCTSSQLPLQIDPLEFEAKFAREPFLISHLLEQHPLFDVNRILELAKRLPDGCIEYNAGNGPVAAAGRIAPGNGLSAEETIRRISDCQSWMALKYIEHDPPYRRLLEECLEIIRPCSEPIAPGMMQPQAFLFLTSPGSITPYHIDPEHNFLLQIRGTKHVYLLDGRDRTVLAEPDLEHFYADRGRNLTIGGEKPASGWAFHLHPGDGLHLPVTYPHWVQNGDDVSISFSITFRTPDLDRRRAMYRINDRLRRAGLKPAPVGQNRLRDWLLFHGYRLARKLAPSAGRPTSSPAN